MNRTNNLIEKWESSLNRANGNFQMIVLETIAKYENGAGKSVITEALSLANPGRQPSFFNSHVVFRVLKTKGMIRQRQDPKEIVYTLNLTKPTKQDRNQVKAAAVKARKNFEVSHK